MFGGTKLLMDHLYDEYILYRADLEAKGEPDPFELVKPGTDELEPVASFTAWADDYLAMQNQPLQVSYLPMGIGLRLQRGEIVSFRPQPDGGDTLQDNSIPIMQPKTIPGMSGIIPAQSVGIFG